MQLSVPSAQGNRELIYYYTLRFGVALTSHLTACLAFTLERVPVIFFEYSHLRSRYRPMSLFFLFSFGFLFAPTKLLQKQAEQCPTIDTTYAPHS